MKRTRRLISHYKTLIQAKALSKLHKKDKKLMCEAYRRLMMFNNQEKPLERAWVGLGTLYFYKSRYFTTFDGRTTPRIAHWFILTTEGVQVMQTLLEEFPIPKSNNEKQIVNEVLYNL